MDPIKEAFQKAKQDISELRVQMIDLTNQITDLRSLITSLISRKDEIPTNPQSNQQTDTPTHQINLKPTQNPTEMPIIIDENPSIQHKNPTESLNELYKQGQYGLKSPNSSFSTGNRGVPTNRQTNQQTDRQTFSLDKSEKNQTETHQFSTNVRLSHINQALESLDSLRQDLKYQFIHLTKQEFTFFTAVYQLENEGFTVDYPLMASKLGLSESSARDYTLKIIKKGLPLVKTKQDNKKIFLSISPELKKIASLSSILALRKL